MQKNVEVLDKKTPEEIDVIIDEVINYFNDYITKNKIGSNDSLNVLAEVLLNAINAFSKDLEQMKEINSQIHNYLNKRLEFINDAKNAKTD